MTNRTVSSTAAIIACAKLPHVVLVFGLVLGCGRNLTADSTVGSYDLILVDGKSLPARVYQSDAAYQDIVRGTLTLNRDGTVLFVTTSQSLLGGQILPQHDTARGRYTREPGLIKLDLPYGSTATLTQDAGTLTLTSEHVFVWRRAPR
jgi:hypothetical protein